MDHILALKQQNLPEDQQANRDVMATEQDLALLVWNRYYQQISAKLLGSLNTVANKSAACRLISRSTKKKVTDKSGNVCSQQERATMMIDFIIDNMEKNVGNAAAIMENFISKGLDERSLEDAQKYLREQLEEEKKKCYKTPESTVLEKSQDNLATRIEGGLCSIAMRLRGNALDISQYEMICNPEAKHTEICMYHLLKEIGDGIKQDSKKLETFINEVIGEMGIFFDDMVTALRAELFPPQDVEMFSDDSDEQVDFKQAL